MSDTTSELVWYIARDGQQHGPITDHEMRVFVDNGHMKPGDLVWNPQLTDWKPAEEVFPKPAPPPVAPPPPPKPVVTVAPEKTAAPQPAADKPLSQASPTSEARSGRSASDERQSRPVT